MAKAIAFYVSGIPKAQPRARAFVMGKGRIRMYTPDSADEWKRDIAGAAKAHACVPDKPLTGALALALLFEMPRPKGHYTKKGLRADAPTYHASRPDADNLAKAVMDALTDLGMWVDDAQVTNLIIHKHYGELPGCRITIAPQGDTENEA